MGDGDKKTILIVDDEEGILRLLNRIVTKYGFTALTASDAMQGLMLVQDNDVDLVITDVRMPGMNGLDLVGQVHDLAPRIPVIVITGYATFETAVDAIERGAFFFVSKPFDTNTLIDIIRKGLRLPHLARANGLRLESVKQTLEMTIPCEEEQAPGVIYQISSTAKNLGFDDDLCLSKIPFVVDELTLRAITTGAAGSNGLVHIAATFTPERIEITVTAPDETFFQGDLPPSFEDSDLGTPAGVALLVAMHYTDTFSYDDDKKTARATFSKAAVTQNDGS